MIILNKPKKEYWAVDVKNFRLLKKKTTKIETSCNDLYKKTESKPVDHDKKKRIFF